MSHRNRLYNLAFRGWLITAVVCLLASSALGQAENDKDVETANQKPEATAQEDGIATPPVTPAPPAKSDSASVYQANCDSPKSRDEADLCEQRRMAAAAEETVKWTRITARSVKH